MHTITLNKTLNIGPIHLEANTRYIVEDTTVAEVLYFANLDPSEGYRATVSPVTATRPLSESKSVLFVRSGGIGDLLFLTPTLRALRHSMPGLRIGVASFSNHLPVLEHSWLVDELVSYPVADYEQWDCILPLENAIEGPMRSTAHAVELLANAAGVLIDDPTLLYSVHDQDRARLLELAGEKSRHRIGIQWTASAQNRDYIFMVPLAGQLITKGYQVVIFGSKNQCKGVAHCPPNTINLTHLTGVTFRESCAILETCDGFIGPDSALIHVAGALSIPAVGLFGPFPSSARTKYAETVFGINGAGDCAPCWHHARGDRLFPEGKQCAKDGYCSVLASIRPERIVSVLERQMREHKAAGRQS